MKMLKVIGTTYLIAGAACFGTYCYNSARWEKHEKLWLTQSVVMHGNPDKYNELIRAGVEDLEVWKQAEAEINDSIYRERVSRDNACRSYFEGLQNANK